jgi:hypothetical protein
MLVLKMIVWQKYGAPVANISMTEELKSTLAKVPLKVMISLFHFCCQQEQLFLKSVDKHLFLSMFWVRIWAIAHSQASVGDVKATPVKTEPPVPQKKTVDRVVPQPAAPVAVSRTEHPNEWAAFLESVAKIDDQLVVSLFAQAKLKAHDKASGLLEVVFLKKFELFQDIFSRKESEWFAILKSVFGDNVQLEPIFEESSKAQPQAPAVSKSVAKQAMPEAPVKKVFYQSNNKVSVTNKDVPLDVSDKATWAMTHSLLEHFPGTVTEFKEDGDE